MCNLIDMLDIKESKFNMVRLRLKDNRFKSKFLFLLLDYMYNQGYTFDMQTGMSNIKNLQMDDYLNIQIPLVERKIQEKIVLLFQDIYLTNSEENQFLGDLFEGFLDQGIKQNEGQFFTPMPI